MHEVLYRITLPYACYGVLCNGRGRCVYAPPIARWMIGESIDKISRWVESKKGEIQEVSSV